MAKTKTRKKEEIALFQDKFSKAKSIVLINFQGLKVKDAEVLRKTAKQQGAEYFVMKKTLFGLALKNLGLPEIETKKFLGNLGLIFGYQNEVVAPKVITQFAKDKEEISIIGGIFENRFIDPNEVKFLASLSSKEELLGQLVGLLGSPLRQLLYVLQGNIRSLIGVLQNLKEKRSTT